MSGSRFVGNPFTNAADTELFKELARLTQAGLNDAPPGEFVLDALSRQVYLSHMVSQLLLQRQIPVRFEPASGSGVKRDPTGEPKNVKPPKRKNKQDHQGDGGKGNGGKSKGSGGKGGGAFGKSRMPMPKSLLGLEPERNGERICFGWNLPSGCNNKNCSKGQHICMRCGSSEHGAASRKCPKNR